MNAVAAVFIVLTFITLSLRLISRLRTKAPVEADDWLIFTAAVRLYPHKHHHRQWRKLTIAVQILS